jgi:hypothetical protein
VRFSVQARLLGNPHVRPQYAPVPSASAALHPPAGRQGWSFLTGLLKEHVSQHPASCPEPGAVGWPGRLAGPPFPARLCLLVLCLLAWWPGAPAALASEPIVELRPIAPEPAPSGGQAVAAPSTRLLIEGSAAGEDFGSTVIEYGRGEAPSQWAPIATLRRPVVNGRLAVWETKALPADRYTVRVTVYSKAGRFSRTQQLVDLTLWRSDLVVRQVVSRLEGATLTVTIDVDNLGRQPAPGPVKMTVGLLNDPPSDTTPLVRLTRWELNGPLPAGGQTSKTGTIVLPSTIQPGRYRVAVVADEEGAVADADTSNNRALADSTIDVGADLIISRLKAALTADGGAVTITDLVANRGLLPTPASTTVAYYLSVDGVIQSSDPLLGHRTLPSLRAGGESEATTRLPLPAALPLGSYFVLGRVNPPRSTEETAGPAGRPRITEMDLTNNDYWGSQITLGPDLDLTALSARIDLEHRQFVITDQVKNVGRYPASGPFAMTYRLLNKAKEGDAGALTPIALLSAPVIGRQQLAGTLSPGEERKTVSTVPLPAGLSAGRYQLVGQLDPDRQLPDSDFSNNQRISETFVIGYDLEVSAVSVEPSSDGLQLKVTETVANQGLLPADGTITVRYLMQEEPARAGAERTETLIGQRTIDGGLAPGARSTGTVTVTPPDNSSGRRWRLVAEVSGPGVDTRADNDRQATESLINEGVDLSLGKTTATLSQTADHLTVTDTVNNDGLAALTRPVRVVYVLSATGLMDGQETVLGARTITALAADGDSTATTTLAVPPTLKPNRYFVVIQVDPDRRVAELKRNNNIASGQRVTIGPEPVLESVDATLKPDGTAVAVKVTVANRGNRPSGPVALTFGISSRGAQSDSMIELGRESVTSLPPGRRATPDFLLPVPATLPAGSYFVTARLDGPPGEQSVTVTPAALPLGPDLLAQSLRAKLLGAGEQLKVSVSDTVVNEGNQGVTRPFAVSYFLSTDWILDGADTPLGRRTIAALPAHEQNSATVQFAVPVETIRTGRYFVLSRIDLEGTVQESDRTNNLRPTVEGLLIERFEKHKKGPDMPDVYSGGH